MDAIKGLVSLALTALLVLVSGTAHARFVSVDPVQADANNGQSFNRYNYGSNNPYKFTDPDGRQAEETVDPDEIESARESFLLQPLSPEAMQEPTPSLVPDTYGEIQQRQIELGRQFDQDLRDGRYSPGGRFSPATKRLAAERANHTCQYCGNTTAPAQRSQRGVTPPTNEAQTDHYEPRSSGGSNSPDNAVHACRACNQSKSNTPKTIPNPNTKPPPPKLDETK